MHRAVLAAALLLSTASSAHAQDATWWDPAPMLVSLRANERATAAQTAGVTDLSSLPLYDLGIDLDDRSGAFALHEEFFFTNTETTPLADVVLRLYVNTTSAQPGVHHPPQRVAVHFDDGHCNGAPCTVAAPSADVIVVTPATPIPPGGRLRIAVNVSGTLPTIDASRTSMFAQGLEGMATMQSSEGGGDGYGLLAIGEGIVSLANFYPMLARRVNGAWERTDASTMGDLGSDDMGFVRAHLHVPAALKVVSTGVEVADRPAQGRTPRTVEIVAALVRDFCVMASRDFEIATQTVNGTTVRSVYLPRDRAAGRQVLDVAAQSLADFERRFGPYPYADLDVVEASLVGGAGGVEFAALVTVASMFYKPAMGTGGAGSGGGIAGLLGAMMGATGGAGGGMDAMIASMREFVTAHEVAHQWWHGIVGSDSRAHPFQDEGLAQWSAMLYLDDRYGHARARHDADMQVRMNYQMMRNQGGADAPVDRSVEQFATPLAYAGLVYGKGPYFYDAVRRELGDTETFADLAEYVRTHRMRMAPPDALEHLFARGRHAHAVSHLAQRWLRQTHGDDDLGRGDPSQMMASMTGMDPGQLGQIMQLLGGAPGSGGSSGAHPAHAGAQGHHGSGAAGNGGDLGGLGALLGGGASGDSQIDPAQLEEMMEMLNGMGQ